MGDENTVYFLRSLWFFKRLVLRVKCNLLVVKQVDEMIIPAENIV